MGQPAAKWGDQVVGVDTHIVMIPSPGGPVPTPLPHPFSGKIMDGCSKDVLINGQKAATKDSIAKCIPPHIPQGGPFQTPPNNQGTVQMGSQTVKINGKDAARSGDMVKTCNDPQPAPTCSIVAPPVPMKTVLIG